MTNLPYYLALNRIKNIGPRTVLKLKKRWPDLKEMFKFSQQQLENEGLNSKIAKSISQFDFRVIEADLLWQKEPQHHILSLESSGYPPLLKEIYDPPCILYAMGDISCLQPPAIAIVGTRNPSITGSENAFRFARELAFNNIVVASGLALGVDAQAHKGCLASKGKTIAVLATGIDQIYPKRHMSLANNISKRGLILSEFPLGTPPVPAHFPRRNRIISGLSLATLVVEAAVKSGSLITARYALEQNREVFAIPDSIHNPKARGCHYLLQQGARLVTSIHDIMDDLGLEAIDKNKKISQEPLATKNEKLVKFIGFETTTVDQIIDRSGLDTDEVISELAVLELNGQVKTVPGGYIRC